MRHLFHASRWQPSLEVFLADCARAGLQPEVLGYRQRWGGFGHRLRRVTAALHGISGPVLFTDAFDVRILGSAAEIRSGWESLGAPPLLCAAETVCWPQEGCAEAYPACETPYRFLNAGGWIGDAAYVRELLRDAGAPLVPEETNDQEWLTELFLSRPGAISLDTGAVVFQCLLGAAHHLGREAGTWRNRLTGSAPPIFHGNAGGDMEFLNG